LVPCHHVSLHHHPSSLLEVRRILYQHARELETGSGVIPVLHVPGKL
jgi:hypothetical protein